MKIFRRVLLPAALIFLMAPTAFAAGAKVIVNGTVASTDVRIINGKAYMPVADVAEAMGFTVVRIPGGYQIKKAGGATPVNGLRGKVGDVLFDGKWRLQILGAEPVETYQAKNKPTADYAVYHSIADFDGTRTFTAKEGRTLVAVRCRVTNGRNSTQALWVSNSDTRTALADAKGESHPPIAYDMEESAPFLSKSLLPGAKLDFTVLFSVPEGTKWKDLVFTLRTIASNDKGNDMRTSLGEAR